MAAPFSLKARRLVSSDFVDSLHTTMDTSGNVVTTLFVSNLHCSSCVHTIEETLSSLRPAPTSIHVSVVSQSVTVAHSKDLSPRLIKNEIEDAGFDIASTPLAGPSRLPDSSFTSSLLSGRRQKHVDQCYMCRNDLEGKHAHGGSQDSLASSSPEKHSEPQHIAIPTSTEESQPFHLTLSVGGMTCASCSSTITQTLSELPGVSDVSVSLLSNSATLTLSNRDLSGTVVEAVEDIGYEADIVDLRPIQPESSGEEGENGPYTVLLSIQGMTCASCSSTITRLVSELDDVEDVNVNLLGNSASVVVQHKKVIDAVVEVIEDAGYDATVTSVEPVKKSSSRMGPKTQSSTRIVSLQVDGMFCHHCPAKVMAALEKFGNRVRIEKPIIDHTDPILRISYDPSPPSFTIRHIISAISSCKNLSQPPSAVPATATPSSCFTVSIYKPPSLEERGRAMIIREQRHMLIRLLFSVLVAIPTFIIGVVFMSLVPSSNPTKAFLMEPMWTGNTSRIQWSLFFLATPVMFGSTGTFHRRSLKELRALWRRGSKTPVWKRFVRFGSMNLLVSSGVSVAYFSSIALLGLAASQEASPDGMGDTTTYFDSVVFLTMFLLIGRYLEAYSKGRTSDAITSLGNLRPSQAYLLVPLSEVPASLPPTSTSTAKDSHPNDSDLEKGLLHTNNSSDSSLAPVKPGLKVIKVPVDLLEIGDVVRVQNGATPPADGRVVEGESTFNESSLTGESRPIRKAVGDEVFLGTLNVNGVVDVRVEAVGGETMLDQVVRVVRDGQTKRAPIERLADHLTGYFVPVVTLLAILTWVIWLGLGLGGALPSDYLDKPTGGWPVWSLEFAIAVFVVACPCGIGLAAPTALLVGSGLAAQFGILVRGGGEAFQEAAQLDVIVFDKTGTLTEGGEPRVTDVEFIDDLSNSSNARVRDLERKVVLGIAAEIESASTHPLATAIRQHCDENGAVHVAGSKFEEKPGRGLKARFEETKCVAIIGNEKWMEENGAMVSREPNDGDEASMVERLEAWKVEGKSVVLLAIQAETEASPSFTIVAMFAISDPLRPNAKDVVSRLQKQGVDTWMISGDNTTTARAIAKMVGIPQTNVIAGVLPHEKAEKITWLQSEGRKKAIKKWRGLFGKRLNERCIVAMVGDGINDAPALASADIAIAIGSGSDVALSSASFILVSSDLSSLLTLVDLSRTVFRRVKFNFLWALMYNLAALPIAAGVIYPAGHARLDPVWGSLAMALSSVSVICSSLALRLYRAPKSSKL